MTAAIERTLELDSPVEDVWRISVTCGVPRKFVTMSATSVGG